MTPPWIWPLTVLWIPYIGPGVTFERGGGLVLLSGRLASEASGAAGRNAGGLHGL